MAKDWSLQFFTIGLLTAWQLSSPRARDPRKLELEIQVQIGGGAGGTQHWAAVFYHLIILEVTSHHFCCVLLVTWTNPGTVWEQITQGCEHPKQGSWGPFRGWLPQCSTVELTVLSSTTPSLSHLLWSLPSQSIILFSPVSPCAWHMLCAHYSLRWNEWVLHFLHAFFLKKKKRDGRNLSETLLYLISLQIWKSRSRKSSLFVSSGAQARIWSLNGFPFSVFSTSLSLNFSLCNLELSLTQNLVALVINHLPLLLCLLCHRLHSTSIEIFSNAFVWFSFYVIISSFCSPSASLALTLNILNGQGFIDIKF